MIPTNRGSPPMVLRHVETMLACSVCWCHNKSLEGNGARHQDSAAFPFQANFTSSRMAIHRPRRSVHVRAMKVSSSEDTSLQGETLNQNCSVVHKTAVVSAKGVKVEGLENKTVITNGNTSLDYVCVPDKDMASSEQVGSVAVGSMKPTEQIGDKMKDLKTWWKAAHEVYQEDTAIWGYGSSPIFTVQLGPDSKIEKVLIDEKEIERRQGVEPLLRGFTNNEESKAQAEEKIMLARIIAKELEMGKRALNRHSTIFAVIKCPDKDENQTARQKLLSQVDVAMYRAAPVLKSAFTIAIPLYGIFILCSAYLMVSKRSEKDIADEEKSVVRLEKMRALKAQMQTHKGSAGVGQLPLAPSDFMQKILEVREMARQVRSEEGSQKLVEDSESNVEEYQPASESSLDKSRLRVGNKEQGGMGPDDAIETTVRELTVPTMDNMAVTVSRNEVIDGTAKPASRVKPRIITSLEEAMAVIGSKQTESLNTSKLGPGLNETGERVLHGEREPQVEQESAGDDSKLHNEHPSVRLGSEDDPQRNGSKHFPLKIGPVPASSFGKQDGAMKKQNNENSKGYNDFYSRLTLVELASQGQSREAQTAELKIREGADDLEEDIIASAHLLCRDSEHRQLDEIQTPSSMRPSFANHLARNDFTNLSNQVSGEVLPSEQSEKSSTERSVSKALLSVETNDIVGSGQPLRRRETNVREGNTFSNTRRWSKELQKKYDLERDPEVRELMKEIGSELDSWVTEEEVEEAARLASKLEEGDEDALHRHYEKVQKKIKEEKQKFGLEAVMEKYKEYQPEQEDELWWLDLRCVLCLMVVTANQQGGGLYGLDMTIDYEGMSNQVARHIIAFEDRKDASNFCRLMELRSGSRFQFAEVCPFSPKRLFEASKEEGFKVTVLRMGQIQTHVDQTLEEVEDKILEIGRSVYWDKVDRDRSLDIDSILHQRFGL